MLFKKRSAEDELAELAPYVNKKVREKVISGDYNEKLQLKVDSSKLNNLLETMGSIPDEHYHLLKEEIDRILKNKQSNRIHLISCISSYMAYFEENGGLPKVLSNMTPSQLMLGLYLVCILVDDKFYKYDGSSKS